MEDLGGLATESPRHQAGDDQCTRRSPGSRGPRRTA
jgi:hypothetical protein